MSALLCFLFGHRWSPWAHVARIDRWVAGVEMPPVWLTNTPWETRMCERGHFEERGFDWDDAPHGVISLRDET